MTTTPHPFAGPVTAAAFNQRLTELDAAIEMVIAAGLVEAATTLDAQALAGQPVVPVTATTGYAVGQPAWVGTVGSGLQEAKVILSIQSGVSLTMTTNLANTHQPGEPVTRSPAEVVDARGTFATLGTRLAMLSGRVFDVVGAVGNGVADDTSAIQATIDLCAAAGGGTVLLRQGIFLVTGLTLPDNVILRGSGWGTVIRTATNSAAIDITAVERVVVRDLKILGSSNVALTMQRGVFLHVAASDCLVENVWVDGCFRSIAMDAATDTIIRGNLVTDDQSDLGAIDLAGNVRRVLVEGNLIRAPRTHGIDVRQEEPQHIRILANHVENAGDTGIVVSGGGSPTENAQFVTVQGNTINDGTYGIIVENGAFHVVVDGNVINSPSGFGIMVGQGTGDPPANTIVSSNMISSAGGRGIFINNGLYSTVANNLISVFGEDGIRVAIGATHVIEGNLISDGSNISGFGIRIDNNASAAVTGNVVRNIAGIGISIEAASCSVTGNHVIDSDNTGVLSVGGISLSADADRTVVSGNVSRRTSGTKQDYGVAVSAGCVNALVIGNSLFENTTGAISDAGTGTVIANNITA